MTYIEVLVSEMRLWTPSYSMTGHMVQTAAEALESQQDDLKAVAVAAEALAAALQPYPQVREYYAEFLPKVHAALARPGVQEVLEGVKDGEQHG